MRNTPIFKYAQIGPHSILLKIYIYIKNATTKQSSEITINKFNNKHN